MTKGKEIGEDKGGPFSRRIDTAPGLPFRILWTGRILPGKASTSLEIFPIFLRLAFCSLPKFAPSKGIRADADRQVTVILANAERDSQILRGEGDGQAVSIFANAYNKDRDFFEFYRAMQAYKKALGKNDTTLVLSPNSEFFKYLQSMDGKK